MNKRVAAPALCLSGVNQPLPTDFTLTNNGGSYFTGRSPHLSSRELWR